MEETATDVVIVDSTSDDFFKTMSGHAEKPLMMLFKRLIGNDSKQNTVLTNAQIIDILQKEFNMDIFYIHELEVDIYLNILKKSLKEWPQWDEFDSAINTLKYQKDYDKITAMLDRNYVSLKSYLQSTLKAVEPLLEATIKEVNESTSTENNVMEDDIVMQLQCTRQQLNQLFFRRPHPHYRNTIFNIEPILKISISNALPLISMLNWPSIRININIFGSLIYQRTMFASLKHVLVNKKLNYVKKSPEVLSTKMQMKGVKLNYIELNNFNNSIDVISNAAYRDPNMEELVKGVCNVIKADLENGPPRFHHPAKYRMNLTKTPYVRYLYSEVNTNCPVNTLNNYDIQLEETISMQVFINFSKFKKIREVPANGSFLRIECLFCDVAFDNSSNLLEALRQHFQEFHPKEKDWQCTVCGQTYTMEYLTNMHWRHSCISSDNNTKLLS